MKRNRPDMNVRRYRRESDKRYLVMVLLTLVVVGSGLIALIYGPSTLLTAVPCLLGGAALILVPWLILNGLEKWRDRMERYEAAELEDDSSPSAQ